MINEENSIIDEILSLITHASIEYIENQIKSGVDIIMIFDTWSNLLKEKNYQKYSLNYINKINAVVREREIPIIYYSRNTYENFNLAKNLDVDVLGINSGLDINVINKIIGKKFALQGNLDVNVLRQDDITIRNSIKKTLDNFGYGSGHIFNLGTGITPDIKPDKVELMIDYIRKISPNYHI